MTDAEIDALAKNALAYALKRLETDKGHFLNSRLNSKGEPVLTFAGASSEGLGAFRVEFLPLDPIKKLVVECESIFDGFTTRGKTRPSPKDRSMSIRIMAEIATNYLVDTFGLRIGDALTETVEDCGLVAQTVMAAVVAELGAPITDMRPEIKKAIDRIGDKKRALLFAFIKALPNVLLERGRGGAYNVKHDWTRQELDCLAKNYQELQPVWREAKRIARAARKSPEVSRRNNWRVEVLRAYPDLPSELLDRYEHLRADDAKPSDIALIHAKIRCGVVETYTARELSDKIRENAEAQKKFRSSSKSTKTAKIKSTA